MARRAIGDRTSRRSNCGAGSKGCSIPGDAGEPFEAQQPGPRSCVYAKCRCFWMHWFVSQPALGSWCRTACGVAGRAWKKMDRLGRRSVLTCSDCGGIMWEIRDGDLSRTENQRSFLAIHGRAWPLTLVAGRGQASGRSDLEGVWLCRIATEQEKGASPDRRKLSLVHWREVTLAVGTSATGAQLDV